MSDFDRMKYQAALKAVKECVQEADDALDRLQFDHGPGGINDRATTHLGSLNDALRDASIKQGEIGRLILKEMAK